jgi:hypothetical protein
VTIDRSVTPSPRPSPLRGEGDRAAPPVVNNIRPGTCSPYHPGAARQEQADADRGGQAFGGTAVARERCRGWSEGGATTV